MRIHGFRALRAMLAALGLGVVLATAQAAEVNVAVAANFTAPMQQLAPLFEQATGHKLNLSFGSAGKFYAQIRNGAPFEVLLSADDETPAKLVKDGAAVAGSAFTYATGRLVLWSAKPGVVDEQGAVLRSGEFSHLALANPQLAPYGRAAVEAMTALGVLPRCQPRFVLGDSIVQSHQFVASGNAELGFVAMSQVWLDGRFNAPGSHWVVPATLHQPIRQDAVLLANGQGKPAATALLQWLQTEPAKAVIRRYGYAL